MAKRYRFRLEPLLRLRRQREDEQKRVVASRLRQIDALRQRQRVFEDEIDHQTDSIRRSLVDDRMDVDSVKLGRHWLVRLRRGVLESAAQVMTQRAILAQERAELAEARKDAKVLARLKERRRDAYLAEVNRQEQAELDDMNVLRFAHMTMTKDDVEA